MMGQAMGQVKNSYCIALHSLLSYLISLGVVDKHGKKGTEQLIIYLGILWSKKIVKIQV